ncbi:MAG: TerB family tellurite resistance protein [Vulcanimicrobiota bacterium]
MSSEVYRNEEVLQKILRALAWSDGELDTTEEKALDACYEKLKLKYNVDDSELDEETLAALPAALPALAARRAFIADLMEVAFADHILTHDEFTVVQRVAERLEIPAQELEELRAATLKGVDPDAWARLYS